LYCRHSGCWYFSTIGKASSDGGPAVIFLFLFTALACSFAAFAYAEFASMVPFQEVHTRIPMSPLGIDGLIIGMHENVVTTDINFVTYIHKTPK
jgi:hypothetical protein